MVRVSSRTGAWATFTVGNQPLDIAPTGAGSVWVANTGDDTVSEVRTSDGAILATLKTGSMPYCVLYDGTSLW